jgi:uncharacterized membrane protein
MHPILLEATEETSKWEVGFSHTSIFLGIVLTTLGILIAYFKLRNQHRETLAAREAAVVERAEQKKLLETISTQFTNNGGGTLLDKVEEGNRVLDEHVKVAEQSFKKNEEQHADIHRRIDGMFELFVGGSANTPRKTAQRHLNREDPS